MQLSSSWVATVFSHQTHSHQGGLVLAAPSRQPQGQGAGDWGTTNQTCRLWFTASESIQPTGKATPQEIRVKLCFPQGVSAKHTMLCLQQGDTVAERCASECAYASACVYIQGSVNKQDWLFKPGMCSIRREDLWMHVSYWSLFSWGLEADNTAFERKMRLYVLGLCAIFCRGKREMKRKKNDRFDKEDRNTLFAASCRRSYCYQHGAALSRQMRDRGQKKQLVGVMFVHQGCCFLWTVSTIMKMKREIEIRDEESFINHSLVGRREQNW